MKKTVQDKRMKATYPQRIQFIAIAACPGQVDLRARRKDLGSSSACAVQGAREERENGVEEDYVGESGRKMIIPPVQEISNLVRAAYLSQGEEEDATCLCMRTMGEQSHGFEAGLLQKAMEEQNLVEYRTREEGEIQVLSKSEKQQTHHRMSAMHESTYQGDVKHGTYREDRSCAKDVVMKRGVEKVKTEYRRKMEYLKMLYTRIFRPLLPGCTGLPVSAS